MTWCFSLLLLFFINSPSNFWGNIPASFLTNFRSRKTWQWRLGMQLTAIVQLAQRTRSTMLAMKRMTMERNAAAGCSVNAKPTRSVLMGAMTVPPTGKQIKCWIHYFTSYIQLWNHLGDHLEILNFFWFTI